MQQLEPQAKEKEGQAPQAAGDPQEAYFDRQAPRYDELLSILDFQMEDAYSYVAEFLQQALLKHQEPRLLELGVGTGTFTTHLLDTIAGAQLLGIELSEEMLARARGKLEGRPGVEFTCGDFTSCMPLEREFHAVASSTAFHFYDIDHTRLFRDIHRVLAPGGRLVYLSNFSHLSTSVDAIAGRMLQEKCQMTEEQKSWMSRYRGETRYFQTPIHWHLSMLEQAGFMEVECIYMRYQIAGISARKPTPRGVSHPETVS